MLPNQSTLETVAGVMEQNMDHITDRMDGQLELSEPAWGSGQGNAGQETYESVTESDDCQIQAFAKLEFDDGDFYMTTYAVELGRDLEAARQCERDHDLDSDLPSENGQNSRRSKKTNGKKSKSSGSSSLLSRTGSRTGSTQLPIRRTNYNALASTLHSPLRLDGFGTEMPMPSPNVTPLLPIHPPPTTEGGPSSHRSISRKHVRISFSFEKHLFEIKILGRNGAFVDEEHIEPGSVTPLLSGSIIQIGGVGIRFILPNVAIGETGAERARDSDTMSSESLSFDVADGIEEDSEDGAELEADEDSNEEVKKEEQEEPGLTRTRRKAKQTVQPEAPTTQKRKGPGRPPKNGHMSKREEALLARQARDEAKAKAERKSGSRAGHNKEKIKNESKEIKVEGSSLQPNGKRKYTKRKKAGETEDPQAVRESTEHTDTVPPEQALAESMPPKPPKEKKPAKPPRSPSPEMNETTMTPEQLAKPQASYVVLIHEALSNSKTGQMSLPQIYRAIERRYPYYRFRVTTQGWQSSVRHNLSQHAAFRKIERDGKGWMWGLVPEVSIEKEKKRRVTPPPVSQQHYYPQNPMPNPYHYGMPVPNGHMPPAPYGHYRGPPPGHMPYAPTARPGLPLPFVNAQSESTYRSPYQSTPPPTNAPSDSQTHQQTSSENNINGHYAKSTPQAQPPNGNDPRVPVDTSASTYQPVASASPLKGHHDPDFIQAVNRFKDALITTMPNKVGAKMLVDSAVDRVLGIKSESTVPEAQEDSDQKIIMERFSTMLEDLKKKKTEANCQGTANAVPILNGSAGNAQQSLISTAIAAENAAKIALTNGVTATSPEKKESKDDTAADGGLVQPLQSDERVNAKL